MNDSLKQVTARAVLISAALIAGSVALGCKVQVESGGEGGAGGEGGSGSSSSGGVVCWEDFGPDAPGECTIGDERECPAVSDGGASLYCREKCVNINGMAVWGLKTTNQLCPFYESAWHLEKPECTCNTPLVLSFDRAPVDFTSAVASYAFDLTGTGRSIATDWPTATTPWLALDRNGDSRIGDGGELFGSATKLTGGGLAVNGFIALRELDSNGDGQISEADEAWSRLLLWSDRDGDRVSQAGELASISSRRLRSIELVYTTPARCDLRGNCEVERAAFRYLDEAGIERAGDVVDVHLKAQGPVLENQ